MSQLLPNGPFYNASSAVINSGILLTMASNIIASSGSLNATSAGVIFSQLQQASSCILGTMTQAQLGFQVSS